MVKRVVSGVLWNAKTPSLYELVGYAGIVAYYDGRAWQVSGDLFTYKNLDILSKYVLEAVQYLKLESPVPSIAAILEESS